MNGNMDLSPYRESAVGLERLFDLLEGGASFPRAADYPSFNIERLGTDRYRIALAVPGFRDADINLIEKPNLLVVSGHKADTKGGDFLFRSIAVQPFERRFILGDFVKVSNAELKDGLLTIDLVREVPEEMKPRKIEIGGG